MNNSASTAEWSLVILGILTVGFIAWQAHETRRSAEAATASIKIQERQLELAHRPWVDIEVAPVSLTFNKGGIQLTVVVSAKNVGSSPSIRTAVEGAIEPVPFGPDTAQAAWVGFLEKTEKFHVNNIVGQTVFAGNSQPSPTIATYNTPMEKLQECLAISSKVAKVEGIIRIILMVSVTYEFHFDEGTIHQTAYLLDVWRKTPQGQGSSALIKPSDGAASENEIKFAAHLPARMRAT